MGYAVTVTCRTNGSQASVPAECGGHVLPSPTPPGCVLNLRGLSSYKSSTTQLQRVPPSWGGGNPGNCSALLAFNRSRFVCPAGAIAIPSVRADRLSWRLSQSYGVLGRCPAGRNRGLHQSVVQCQSGALLDFTDLYVYGFVGVYRSRLVMRVM